MSTKTHTNNTNQSNNRHLFPQIMPMSNKNTTSLILERILEIERKKKINKIHLQQELAKIGKT